MKMKKLALIALLPLMLIGCSSKKSDGTDNTSNVNTPAPAAKTLEEANSMFDSQFASFNFQNRQDAVNKYMEMCRECADAPTDEDEIPDPVWRRINTIIPPIPSEEKVQADLVGKELEEGKEDGYFDESWHWMIERGQISDFTIVKEANMSPRKYKIEAQMKLKKSSSYGFDTEIEIVYELKDGELDWTIDYVQSLGMNIIRTGDYEGKVQVKDDVCLENKCSIPLLVGYTWVTSDGARKDNCVVKGYERRQVKYYGTVSIDFIEKNY